MFVLKPDLNKFSSFCKLPVCWSHYFCRKKSLGTEDMHLSTPSLSSFSFIHFFLDDRWAIPKDGFISQNFLEEGVYFTFDFQRGWCLNAYPRYKRLQSILLNKNGDFRFLSIFAHFLFYSGPWNDYFLISPIWDTKI